MHYMWKTWTLHSSLSWYTSILTGIKHICQASINEPIAPAEPQVDNGWKNILHSKGANFMLSRTLPQHMKIAWKTNPLPQIAM